MSKPITISLQNLNTLYFKFISQFVLQHLPKNIYNDVSTLLGLKSAVQVYRYLDKLLSLSEQRKDADKRSQIITQRSNISNQGSNSYVDKDDLRYQNELLTVKKNAVQLKRTSTYQVPQQKFTDNNNTSNNNNNKYEQYNNLKNTNTKKQDNNNNTNEINSPSIKPAYNNQILTPNHINVVKHDFDTVSQKQNINSLNNSNKRQSKQVGELITNNNNNYLFKVKKQSDTENNHNKYTHYGSKQKEKSDQALSASNNYKKIQFSKTYSIRQTQTKILTQTQTIQSPNNNHNNLTASSPLQFQSLNSNTNSHQSSHNPIANRSRLTQLIKQTKQIFNQNSKKISRYEKISSDITIVKQQNKTSSQTTFNNNLFNGIVDSNTNFNNNYMYKKY